MTRTKVRAKACKKQLANGNFQAVIEPNAVLDIEDVAKGWSRSARARSRRDGLSKARRLLSGSSSTSFRREESTSSSSRRGADATRRLNPSAAAPKFPSGKALGLRPSCPANLPRRLPPHLYKCGGNCGEDLVLYSA